MRGFSDSLPDELLAFIAKHQPGFACLREVHQQRLARMLWQFTNPAQRHRAWGGAAFSSKAQEKLWGNRRTRNAYVGEYFSVIQGDNIGGMWNSFLPMDFMGRALMEFLRSPKPMVLREPGGKKMAMPRNVVLSRAVRHHPEVKHAKHSVWARVRPSATVPLNQVALEQFIDNSPTSYHQLSALRLLRLSRNTLCPGEIPVLYRQASTGRISECQFGLQSTPREVLSAALSGCWDYDIQNAHFGIFAQWARKLRKRTPVVDEYMGHKRVIREDLARHCAVPIEDIKESLVGLLYGATLHPDPEHARIADLLGAEGHRLFSAHPFVRGLKQEISRIGGHIVDDLPRHAGEYGNALGIYVPPAESRPKPRLLCHGLQGVEGKILKTVIERFGINILLPMHDGWVVRDRLSRIELETLITEVTGFELAVEEVQLPKYPPKADGGGALHFADSAPSATDGLWVSAAPQWSEPEIGRRTRTDLAPKPGKQRKSP